tara:strand:+ start:677 stop:958 length:282 start_codon:yes stop_codon:yes gene_type:complete
MFRSLNNIIHTISHKERLKKYFIYDKIKIIWKNQIDGHIQHNTELLNFYNNTLIIRTKTPTWKTELNFQKAELLKIINTHLKSFHKIKDIKFI